MSNGKFGRLGIALGLSLCGFCLLASGQDRDRDQRPEWGGHWDESKRVYTELVPGTVVAIRTNEPIDVERSDNRVYYGTVDQDVRGDNGRIAIPRGSNAELMVRVARDNDLILDLESVVVNGQRYAIKSEPNRVESQRDNSLVGAIVGAINGGAGVGRAVRVPRGSIVTFRLNRPLDIGVEDRGVTRNGYHYHDWYNRDRQ